MKKKKCRVCRPGQFCAGAVPRDKKDIHAELRKKRLAVPAFVFRNWKKRLPPRNR